MNDPRGRDVPGVLPGLQPVMAFPTLSDRYLWEERRQSPDPSRWLPPDQSRRRRRLPPLPSQSYSPTLMQAWPLNAAVLALVVLVALQGLLRLLQPNPSRASLVFGVVIVTGATAVPLVAVWLNYRSARPWLQPTPWQGAAPELDGPAQAELLVSPAAAMWAAGAAVVVFTAGLVMALLLTPVAWLGVVAACAAGAVLLLRLLRPTVLVVNDRGFGVRSWRRDRRLFVPWADVDTVAGGPQGTVLVMLTEGAGQVGPAACLELRKLGHDGAEQVLNLLSSYFAAHQQQTGS